MITITRCLQPELVVGNEMIFQCRQGNISLVVLVQYKVTLTRAISHAFLNNYQKEPLILQEKVTQNVNSIPNVNYILFIVSSSG